MKHRERGMIPGTPVRCVCVITSRGGLEIEWIEPRINHERARDRERERELRKVRSDFLRSERDVMTLFYVDNRTLISEQAPLAPHAVRADLCPG